jgi:hypothetical protein
VFLPGKRRVILIPLLTMLVAWMANAAESERDFSAVVSRIKRERVLSRGLAAVGYSRHLHALEIQFVNGAVYRYLDVPLDVYRKLMAANSKARFYDENVRRKYRSVHVRSSEKKPPVH